MKPRPTMVAPWVVCWGTRDVKTEVVIDALSADSARDQVQDWIDTNKCAGLMLDEARVYYVRPKKRVDAR